MYLRKTTRKYKGKTYCTYLLVESLMTDKGPRQRTVCSLGGLEPRPREQWLALARHVEAALMGQQCIDEQKDAKTKVDAIVDRIKAKRSHHEQGPADDMLAVDTGGIEVEQAREAGPVHVGHQMWQRLDMDTILKRSGLEIKARVMTQLMVMNRFVAPSSELAMPAWIRRTALSDILKQDMERLNEDVLYRNMDKIYPAREKIEAHLARKEQSLFHLQDSILLYDLTSTYFEGQCPHNPQAKLGYSRDKRPDCKQLVVGLVVDWEGFPKAHEVFDGNQQDRQSVPAMLDTLERRTGRKEGATVVVDRGMAYQDNLEQIQSRGYHYIVACRQPERDFWLDEFEDVQGWQELVRTPSPRNPGQEKTRVFIKRQEQGQQIYVLCLSDGRKQKDRAIRRKQEARLLADVGKLSERIEKGSLQKTCAIHQAIGRLKERYPRVARYYAIDYDEQLRQLIVQERKDKKAVAEKLDGAYMLKTDRKDLSDEEIWRTYILLTRVENAFRNMKSPLAERPIFHHLKHRAQTHIFLCVLAYHLLVCIEKMFLDKGIHTSWASIRQALSTHQIVTIALPMNSGETIRIRKDTKPEKEHIEIYDVLGVPHRVMPPRRLRAHEQTE
jgi:transposase